jgi:DNA-binding beta-propeller fold protein YncE
VLDTHTWGVRHVIEMVSAAEKAVLLPSRDGQRLYMAGVGEQNIYVFETKLYQRQAIYRPGGRVKDMTLDRDGRTLYVLLEGRAAPVAVDVVGSSGVSAAVEAGPATELAGATKILYADSSPYKWLCLMDPAADKIWLVDVTPSDAQSRTINAVAVGDNPSAMLQLPASDKLMVANKGAGTLSVVSLRSGTVEDTVDVHSNPVILALP